MSVMALNNRTSVYCFVWFELLKFVCQSSALAQATQVEFSAGAYRLDESAGTVAISVCRAGNAALAFTVDYATSNGPATAGADYTAQSGTLIFGPIETIKQFTVPLFQDSLAETNETINLTLSDPFPGGFLGWPTHAVLRSGDDAGTIGLSFGNWSPIVSETAGFALVNVIRSGNLDLPATVNYSTADGTAIGGQDYVPVSGTFYFAPGQFYIRADIPLINDPFKEGDETFAFSLSNPGDGAALAPTKAVTFTIRDNETGIAFRWPEFWANEVDGTINVVVDKNWDATNTVSVKYATRDGTAIGGLDYVMQSGLLTFSPTEFSKTITIPLLNDALPEELESFQLTLSDPVGEAALGQPITTLATIIDSDVGIEFTAGQYVARESNGSITLFVRRGDDATNTFTVEYITLDGTATAGTDYGAQAGILTLSPGITNTISIPILDNPRVESDKTFSVILRRPSRGSNLGQHHSAMVRVVDDDGRPGGLDFGFAPPTLGLDVEPLFGAQSVASQPDGKIMIGSFSFVARLDRDGSKDTGFVFSPEFSGAGYMVAVQSDDKVVVGTSATGPILFPPADSVFRLHVNGSREGSIVAGVLGWGWARALQLQGNGKILAGGSFLKDDSTTPTNNAVARLNADGSIDRGFNAGTFLPIGFGPIVLSLAMESDDKILVGGTFTSINGMSRNGIARLNSDGSLDRSFFDSGSPQGCDGLVRAIAVQLDGKILIGGAFSKVHGVSRNHLARLLPGGALDASFTSPLPSDANVNAIKLQIDGKIVVGTGSFVPRPGSGSSSLVRLLSDGSIDPNFDPGTGPNGPVNDLVILPNGDIVIVGGFTAVNGIDRWLVARLKGDGLKFRPPIRLPDGSAKFTFNTQPGQSYVIQASADLREWSSLMKQTADGATIDFIEPAAPKFPQRFYRVLQLPP